MTQILTAARALVSRLVSPLVGAVVAWLTSLGLQLPPEFAESVETAALLLVMAIVTALVESVRSRFARGEES